MNHGNLSQIKKGKATKIRSLADFLDFKRGDKSKIVAMKMKKKMKVGDEPCE